MSKRTQSIRSMFAANPDEGLSADNNSLAPRVTAGAVKSLRDTFSDVERDYQALREQLSVGAVAIEIDPKLIDPSPFADRLEDEDQSSFEVLKRSLADHGQEVPILVREHPTAPGRYQSAYGHRRVSALRQLNHSVKAYVRVLSDEELVLAQGIENSAREDLSFIERAVFALKLEERGFQRSVVQSALSVDRAEASKLVAVAKAVPSDVVMAVGRAPKVGRSRWQSLAEQARSAPALARMREAIGSDGFSSKTSDERFESLLTATKAVKGRNEAFAHDLVARSDDGLEIARLSKSAKQWRIQIGREQDDAFAAFVMEKLPTLYDDYRSERSRNR